MHAQTEIEKLDDEVAQLFAEVFAITARALEKLREFDALDGPKKLGFQSCAHWLNHRVGLSLGTAREHIRVAHALTKLPEIAAAFSAGTLSFSKVRALTRIANPKNESDLLAMAEEATASKIEKIVRACRRLSLDEAKAHAQARSVEMGFDDEGMFFMRVRLLPDEGARLMHALDANMPSDKERDAQERRADALLAALSEKPQTELVVHVDADEEGRMQVETPRGERVGVSAETCRRLSCDASVVVMRHDSRGNVLDVGRKTRRISTPLRRALAERDGGCRFPGCPNHLVDAHHVKAWADGGETKLANLLTLCRFHHGQVHEGGYQIAVSKDDEAVRPRSPRRRAANSVAAPTFGRADDARVISLSLWRRA